MATEEKAKAKALTPLGVTIQFLSGLEAASELVQGKIATVEEAYKEYVTKATEAGMKPLPWEEVLGTLIGRPVSAGNSGNAKAPRQESGQRPLRYALRYKSTGAEVVDAAGKSYRYANRISVIAAPGLIAAIGTNVADVELYDTTDGSVVVDSLKFAERDGTK